jgi:hypothetical protein
LDLQLEISILCPKSKNDLTKLVAVKLEVLSMLLPFSEGKQVRFSTTLIYISTLLLVSQFFSWQSVPPSDIEVY